VGAKWGYINESGLHHELDLMMLRKLSSGLGAVKSVTDGARQHQGELRSVRDDFARALPTPEILQTKNEYRTREAGWQMGAHRIRSETVFLRPLWTS